MLVSFSLPSRWNLPLFKYALLVPLEDKLSLKFFQLRGVASTIILISYFSSLSSILAGSS